MLIQCFPEIERRSENAGVFSYSNVFDEIFVHVIHALRKSMLEILLKSGQ